MKTTPSHLAPGLGAAVVLYILSIGPVAAAYMRHSTTPPAPILAFYAPLVWCIENFPPFGELMFNYVNFCEHMMP